MDFFTDHDSRTTAVPASRTGAWCVLMVDDEAAIHGVTRLALSGFEFQDRPLELLSAHSAAEAREIFGRRSDIAVALIDVVMENEHAGLDLIRYLRDECNNRLTRLVLRTGQAGQAPEDHVIRAYEIDDYKEKTELTTQKLRTLLYSTLRAYRDLALVEAQRNGLGNVLQACAEVQHAELFHGFSVSVVQQLDTLLGVSGSTFCCVALPAPGNTEREPRTLTITGELMPFGLDDAGRVLPAPVVARLRDVLAQRASVHIDDGYVLYMPTERRGVNLLCATFPRPLDELDRQLVEIYLRSVGATFENLNLMEDLQESSKELVYTLADAVEARSKETGAHVQRVALISERLAQLIGLDERETRLIKDAAPLHDIGKVAIPDAILHKPGKLSADEWAVMQRHVEFGVAILKRSRRELMRVGAIIAGTHHERWDGAGYPNGLRGDAIPMAGRIAALADVFDALGSKRSYKEPWSPEQMLELIVSERGRQFDPQLVDAFAAHYADFLAIRAQHPDRVLD